MVVVQGDVDMVVTEIVSVVLEAPVKVVTASSMEDVVVIIMLITLLILRHMFLVLLKDVALLGIELLRVPQVMVVDKVVVQLIPPAVATVLPVLSGDGATVLPVMLGNVKVNAVADLLLIPHIAWTSAVGDSVL